jgi:SAM-dependent MidA family methyltransferase
MTAFTDWLADRITAEGPLPFETFMEWALYHPEHGYYTSGEPFGAEGDFYTGPAVSDALGRALGRCLAARLAEMGIGPADLVELGAGDGRLAAATVPVLQSRLGLRSLHLVDRNPARLPETVGDVPPPVHRHADAATLPDDLAGAVYGNELLDALPVCRLAVSPSGNLKKSWIDVRAGRLLEIWRPESDPAALEYARRYLPAGAAGLAFEYSLHIPPLLAQLGRCLRRGFVVWIDYGGRAPEVLSPARPDGTLRAFRRHRVSGALLDQPGRQDLTADVNFDFVTDQARACGFEPAGYSTQGQFLAENGILEEFLEAVDPSSLRHNLALKRLLLPGGMGEVFKILILRRSEDPTRSNSSPSHKG